MKAERMAREASAISDVTLISVAQTTYQTSHPDMGKNGAFADLRTLGNEGPISADLASGQKGGYQFASTPSRDADGNPIFDTTAVPLSTWQFRNGGQIVWQQRDLRRMSSSRGCAIEGNTY